MSSLHNDPDPEDKLEIRRRLSLLESDLTDVKQIKDDLRTIRNALVGDEALGHKGIVARVAYHERLLIVLVLVLITMGGERLVHLFI